MKTHLLQLNSFDDSYSILDKLSWSRANRILVVWPNSGKIELSELDLILILRKSVSLGSQIAFVCDEQRIVEKCNYIGIQVFSSIPDAYRKPWRRSKRLKRFFLDDPKKELTSLTNFYQNKRKQKYHLSVFLRVTIFIFAICAFLVLIGFFIPSAEIRIKPVTQEIKLDFNMWANEKIAFPNVSGAVPIDIVSIEMTDTIEGVSTGSVRIPSNFASGRLVFRNLTNSSIVIPKGTVVLRSENPNLRFQTNNEVTLKNSNNSETEVQATCLIGGVIGNIPANYLNAIEGLIGGNVVVENKTPFIGGSELKSLSPSTGDYEKAKQLLIEKMKKNALIEFRNLYPEGFLFPEETLVVSKTIFEERTPEIDFPGEKFRYQADVEFSIWMVKKENIEVVINNALSTYLPKDYEIVPDSQFVKLKSIPTFDEKKDLRWILSVSEVVKPEIEPNQIIQQIAGKNLDSAKRILGVSSILLPESLINIFPSFWKRLPFLPFRIEVIINE
ncbi:MAG: hypothetical protein CVU46_03775 [Chloroflexi bacterium HGW-Chloroflexi-8]|jgi:hypothetical protein|nr:MAG: hypothetical protein CVU46_03775 [Chloroflexi bacterium HGW-Chloroflexi-8]